MDEIHSKMFFMQLSIWFYNRGQKQYHSIVSHRTSLHEQLKLAGAARGLPGDHGHANRPFFAFQYVLPPARQTSGHEPCPASRTLFALRTLFARGHCFLAATVIIILPVNLIAFFIALGSLNAADGWVSPSPLHWVPRTRCKLAAFPQRHVLPFLLVVIGLSSPIMNLLPTLGALLRTCRPLWAA